MRTFRSRTAGKLAGMVVAVLVALAGVPPASAAEPRELRIMTGVTGGLWLSLGGGLSEVVRRELPGVTLTVLPGAGSANVEGVEIGKAEVAFANAVSVVDGEAGRPPFKKPTRRVRSIATLFPSYFHVITRSAIRSVAELKGKSIAVAPKGNTGEIMAQHVLAVHGLGYKDMRRVQFMSYGDSVNLMKDGHIDGFMLLVGVPAAAVMDLTTTMRVNVLGTAPDKMEALRTVNKGYIPVRVPRGTYKGIDEDVQTFGTATVIIVRDDFPEDLAHGLTRAVAKNIPDLAAIAKDMKAVTPAQLAIDAGVPLHPGAQRYYKESGAIQ